MLKKQLLIYCLALFFLPVRVMAAECNAPTCYSLISAKDNYHLEIQTTQTVPINQLFSLDIIITNSEGKPLTSKIDLDLDASMPQHNHGMNVKPVIKNLGEGKFQVEGMLFHMSGAWTLSFTITKGITREAAQWVVEVQ
ncbi:FixH family protein [uncultured Thiothrix sp.]|uniref:FixH family protein n=1 Tax=uncultured Thiothrix sp. TaxID=223185 RepID=UPI002626FC41|nr:FixH family protein [uncultured Thiothrix sp.]